MKQSLQSNPPPSNTPSTSSDDSDSFVFTSPLPRVSTMKPSASATSSASSNNITALSLPSSPSPPLSLQSPPYSRKRKGAAQMSDFQSKILESLHTTNIPQSAPAASDIYSRFGEDIAEQLRDLTDDRQKHIIMRDVRDILYKARFEEHGCEPTYYNFDC